jgi:hypothetical protein
LPKVFSLKGDLRMPSQQETIGVLFFSSTPNTANRWSRRGFPEQPTNPGVSWLTAIVKIQPQYFIFLSPSSSISAIGERFTQLAEAWEKESTYLSSMERMCMLAPYQEIMTMGWSVVGPILRRMAKEPDWWFWALRFITGEDPVPAFAQGDLKQMTDAWLQWGRRRSLL